MRAKGIHPDPSIGPVQTPATLLFTCLKARSQGNVATLRTTRLVPDLFYRRPDAMNVVMIFDGLQEIAHLTAFCLAEFCEILRHVTNLAGHHRPTDAAPAISETACTAVRSTMNRAPAAPSGMSSFSTCASGTTSFAPASIAAASASVPASG